MARMDWDKHNRNHRAHTSGHQHKHDERLADVQVTKHHETDRAILVSLDGNRAKGVWLPKSGCEFVPTGRAGVGIVTLAEGLAFEKGLI